ncbi:unnamed protein product [Orchesella dallaii]|uniref:Uncharacterized protein n=1 Tax=Orchesella dallaii TaxID=48710 RepID=A0ABP1RHC0_9HEXA
MTTKDDLMEYLKKEFLSLNKNRQRIQDGQKDMQMRMTTMENKIQAISDSSKAHDESIEELREDNTELERKVMTTATLDRFGNDQNLKTSSKKSGRSVVIIANNQLDIQQFQFKCLEQSDHNSKIEVTTAKVKPRENKSIIVVIIYRPPNY